MKTNDYTIRLEKKEDYRKVENLVRESFWNVYRPGRSEHFVIHVLRDDPAFVKELDFVMEQNGKLIGQNMFMRTVIEADDGRVIPVLTMGPIGITLSRSCRGRGQLLLPLQGTDPRLPGRDYRCLPDTQGLLCRRCGRGGIRQCIPAQVKLKLPGQIFD